MLFSKRGYEAVGVQEIVEAAGVTKPTLYHYFGNKIGVFQEVVSRNSRPFLEDLRTAADYQGDLPLTLHRVFQAYFQEAKRSPDYFRLQLALWFAPPESEEGAILREQLQRQFQLLIELFEGAARDHGNMRGRSEPYAVSLLGTINSYVGLFLLRPSDLGPELAFKAVHQFMHGIYS